MKTCTHLGLDLRLSIRSSAFVLACLVTSSASAESITAGAALINRYRTQTGTFVEKYYDYPQDQKSSGTAQVQVGPGGLSGWSGSGAAKTNFGVNRAKSALQGTVSLTAGATSESVSSIAFSRWYDSITFLGGTGTGSISLDMHITGSIAGAKKDSLGNDVAYALQDVYVGNSWQRAFYTGANGTYDQTVSTRKMPIVFGQATDILIELDTWIEQNVYSNAPSASLDATVDFFNTSFVSGITVYNGDGSVNSKATWSSKSGTTYPVNPVPEPASIVALSVGALALLRRRRS